MKKFEGVEDMDLQDHSSKFFCEWDRSELGGAVAIDLFWENMWVAQEVEKEIWLSCLVAGYDR